MAEFRKGDRVRLTPAGIAAGIMRRREGGPEGAVGAINNNPHLDGSCVSVRWEGWKNGSYVARRFVELIESKGDG
jgi:hypothetical protein